MAFRSIFQTESDDERRPHKRQPYMFQINPPGGLSPTYGRTKRSRGSREDTDQGIPKGEAARENFLPVATVGDTVRGKVRCSDASSQGSTNLRDPQDRNDQDHDACPLKSKRKVVVSNKEVEQDDEQEMDDSEEDDVRVKERKLDLKKGRKTCYLDKGSEHGKMEDNDDIDKGGDRATKTKKKLVTEKKAQQENWDENTEIHVAPKASGSAFLRGVYNHIERASPETILPGTSRATDSSFTKCSTSNVKEPKRKKELFDLATRKMEAVGFSTPFLARATDVSIMVLTGDVVEASYCLGAILRGADVGAILREEFIMSFLKECSAHELKGSRAREAFFTVLLDAFAAPFDDRYTSILSHFYRDNLMKVFEKVKLASYLPSFRSRGLKLGKHLFTPLSSVGLLPMTAKNKRGATWDHVYLDMIEKNQTGLSLLTLLGPSALNFTFVNETNFSMIPLLDVDEELGYVTDRKSLFCGMRNARTLEEWLSLRGYIVVMCLSSSSSKMLPQGTSDTLLCRSRSVAKNFIAGRVKMSDVFGKAYARNPGPEAAFWGSNLVWESFATPPTNAELRFSKLHVMSMIYRVAYENCAVALRSTYKHKNLLLDVRPLMVENCYFEGLASGRSSKSKTVKYVFVPFVNSPDNGTDSDDDHT